MLTRKIGSFLRGSATPFQIYAACLLGALIGFAPPFSLAPGLVLLYLGLLLVLNANLFVAALVTVGSRLLALVLAPVAYGLGVGLLEGPARPVFGWAVNAPVLAWFGLDLYAAAGGVPLALVVGSASGFSVCALLSRFRRKMHDLEEGSERYRAYRGKGWVRALSWVLFGGATKKSYEQLSARRVGKPVRMAGVAVVLGALAVGFLAQQFLAGPILTAVAQRELERANGATVDLAEASVDLAGGRAVLSGLAMADAEDLDRNIFAAERVEVDISGADLLRKRATLTLVEASGASSGGERATRGRLVRPAPAPPAQDDEDAKTIDDYIAQAEMWKDRLTRLREWVDSVSGGDPDAEADDDRTREERREAERARRRRAIASAGYRAVHSAGLVEDTPSLLIERLVSRGVEVARLEGETVDIEAENLSTQPWLVEGEPRVTVRSSGGTIDAAVALGGAAAGGAGENRVDIAMNRLDADALSSMLIRTDPPLLSGGTVSLALNGSWPGPATSDIDLTLAASPRDTTLALPGIEPTEIDAMTLPISLTGPLNNPAVGISDEAVRRALVDAGKRELFDRLSDRLDLSDALDGEGGSVERGVRDAVGGLFGNRGGDDGDDGER